MAEYTLIYRDILGNRIGTINSWFRLEYTRKEGEFGSLYIDLPPTYSIDYFKIDNVIEVWRKVGAYSPQLDMDSIWFIRLVRHKIDDSGKQVLHVLCHDAVHLIERRIIAYPKSDSLGYSKKTDYADDILVDLASENLGSGCVDPNRDISDYLVIAPSLSLAPSITMEFAWRKLLPAMQDICNISKGLGTYLTFDVTKSGNTQVKFVTYVGQRGVNRGLTAKNGRILATIENGILSYASFTLDYTDNYNYIYAGGQGEEENRNIQEYGEPNSLAVSPVNRYEDWVDARDSEEDGTVLDQAKRRAAECMPKLQVNGHVQQVENALYGVHYFFGDIIACKYNNSYMDIHLDTVHITLDEDHNEEIEIYSRNLEDTEY